jgi:hypothetical protein
MRQISRRACASSNWPSAARNAAAFSRGILQRQKAVPTTQAKQPLTGMLIVWVVVNTVVLARLGGGFDTYPYIVLNLILSMVAALQAPVIPMSQNRHAARDRLTASLEDEINLKAEVEIMALHDKLDRLRMEELEEVPIKLNKLIISIRFCERPSPRETWEGSRLIWSSRSGLYKSRNPIVPLPVNVLGTFGSPRVS